MVAFTEASTRRVLSPWGVEVKKRLIERSLKQDDLVAMLVEQGHRLLDIPYLKQTASSA